MGRGASGAARFAWLKFKDVCMGWLGSAWRAKVMALVVVQGLWGCAGTSEAPGQSSGAGSRNERTLAAQAPLAFENWTRRSLPGKRATRYQPLMIDGRWAVQADSDAAVSLFRRKLRIEPGELNSVEFSWRVPELISSADLTQRATADSPVRLVLAFDGDRSKLSQKNRLMFDLAESLTGEQTPYATLMYVWENRVALETVIPGATSDRIRKVVVDSGPSQLNLWRLHRRRIVEDYRRAFGEDPGPLIGVAFMTDSDNTRSHAKAWYGEVRFIGNGDAPGP